MLFSSVRFVAEDAGLNDVFANVNVANPNSGEYNAHLMRVLGGVDIVMNLMDLPRVSSLYNHILSEIYSVLGNLYINYKFTFKCTIQYKYTHVLLTRGGKRTILMPRFSPQHFIESFIKCQIHTVISKMFPR